MLTIFTVPKPFRGHIDVIQRNAIHSWLMLRPECEIILFGDEEGMKDVAEEFGVRHIPDVARNEYGTPLISDFFAQAEKQGRGNILAYVNTDILLFNDFIEGVKYVARRKRRFLVSGQRWNLDIFEPLDFTSEWEATVRGQVARKGELYDPAGIDYFVFRRGIWGDIPAFAIGRTIWDNWLIYRARQRGATVVDATRRISAIHQNHDYGHLRNGKTEAWEGPEARRNFELAGGDYKYAFTLRDANRLLTPDGLRMARTREHLERRWETLKLFHPRLHYFLLYIYSALNRRINKVRHFSRGLLTRH
jgi:hypothetical protein